MDEVRMPNRMGKGFEYGYEVGYEQGAKDAKESQKKWLHSVVKHMKKMLKFIGFYDWQAVMDKMPESEFDAYAESRKRIENMEKIIEDQQERIDIMAADMPVWIDITKEPPTKDDRDILVISEGEVCFCTHYVSDNGRHEYETPDIFESFPIENITHWMRCPKPLKGADDNVNA